MMKLKIGLIVHTDFATWRGRTAHDDRLEPQDIVNEVIAALEDCHADVTAFCEEAAENKEQTHGG